jgi:hypothetical protein
MNVIYNVFFFTVFTAYCGTGWRKAYLYGCFACSENSQQKGSNYKFEPAREVFFVGVWQKRAREDQTVQKVRPELKRFGQVSEKTLLWLILRANKIFFAQADTRYKRFYFEQ